MSNDLHALSVPVFQRGLTNLTALLQKAEAHATEHKIAAATLLTARLFPDMFTLTGQVQTACDTAKRGVARLAVVEPPPFPDDENSFEQLYTRIEKTVSFITAQPTASFQGAEDRIIEMKMRAGVVTFKGFDYLTRFALPNFYFHVTTAYNLLRHNGVIVGKMDFLGKLAAP